MGSETISVVCTSDFAAFRTLSECKRLGIRIPEDFSITGFNDSDYDAYLDPPLTNIAVSAREMGFVGVDMLFAALTIEDPPRRQARLATGPQKVSLPSPRYAIHRLPGGRTLIPAPATDHPLS